MAEPSTNTEMVRVPILGENGRISDDYIPESIPQAVTAVEQAAVAAASSANEALQKAAAAEKSASSASSSAEQAKSYANNANTYMTTAESHAGSAATDASAASKSASAAAASAEHAAQSASSLSTAVTDAQSAATAAKESAAQAATSESSATSAASAAESSASAAKASETAAGSSAERAATSATQASSSAEAAAGSAQTATKKANSVLDHYIESAQATTLEPGSQATASVADNVLTIGVPKGEKGDTGLGIPEGGSAGQVVKKTADGAEWAYNTGAVYNSEEGLQEMSEDGTNDPIYNFGITQGGMSASMSVMGNSPEVAASYTSGSTNYKNAIGADADGPYVDLNLPGKTGGATKYRYIDDPSQLATVDGIPTAKAVASAIGGGNVLKGTLGPAPALSADDAYATKPRRLTVHGATRQNLWVNPSGTNNGVTVTSNGDGSMALSGTATSAASVSSADSYIIKPSTAYTLSMNAALTGASFIVTEYDADGSQLAQHNASSTSAASFTSSASVARCVMSLSVQSGQAVSGTYRVMLNEGSEAQPWCPPGLNSVGDDSSVKIVTAGKNLLKISSDLQTKTINGVTFTPNEDGTVTVNGTATSDVDYYFLGTSWQNRVDNYLPVQELVFSSNSAAKLYGFDSSGSTILAVIVNGGNQIISAEQIIKVEKFVCYLSYASGHGETNKKVYAQLELGSTATVYEPPQITTTSIDLDGHTLNSLPDGTRDELTIDATGAVTLTKRTQTVQLDGDGTWFANENPYKYYISAWSNYGGLPSGYSDARNFVDKLPASSKVANGLYSADTGGIKAYLREPTFASDAAGVKGWMSKYNPVVIMPLLEPQTIPLTAVTLPTLPSPNITVYHDSDVPSDISVEYERDVTIAFDKLEAKVSELTVSQATS